MKITKSKLSRRTTKTSELSPKATKKKQTKIAKRIIPSIKDFKKTTYYEDLLYNDEGQPINPKTITSDVIRKYILEMNMIEYNHMIKEIKEIKNDGRQHPRY